MDLQASRHKILRSIWSSQLRLLNGLHLVVILAKVVGNSIRLIEMFPALMTLQVNSTVNHPSYLLNSFGLLLCWTKVPGLKLWLSGNQSWTPSMLSPLRWICFALQDLRLNVLTFVFWPLCQIFMNSCYRFRIYTYQVLIDFFNKIVCIFSPHHIIVR